MYVLLQLQQSADPIAVFIVACIGMRMKILRQLRAGQYLLGLVAFRTVRMFFLSADQVVVCIVATVAMRVLRLRAYQNALFCVAGCIVRLVKLDLGELAYQRSIGIPTVIIVLMYDKSAYPQIRL